MRRAAGPDDSEPMIDIQPFAYLENGVVGIGAEPFH